MDLKIFLLGQFKLLAGFQPIKIPSRPAQSLMAYLAINPGIIHRREMLACLIWPNTSDKNARAYLRQAIWLIRKAFREADCRPSSYFHITPIEVQFCDKACEVWCDVSGFLSASHSHDVSELKMLVDLYQGDLLPGFHDEWVLNEREHISAAYHHKMSTLLSLLAETGDWEGVLSWGEVWLSHSVTNEQAMCALMQAYAALGDQAMVTLTYRRCLDALKREFHQEPSTETKEYYLALKQQRKETL